MPPRTHDFATSLAYSAAQADAPFWMPVYREAFPDLESAVNVRKDGWAQRGGIDRVLVRGCGKTHYVDEKVRKKDGKDILLEFWSDYDRKTPGWARKDLACDFIAYAFVPSRRCFLLPFETLRRSVRENEADWIAKAGRGIGGFHRVEAQNRNWLTVSVAVPIPDLMDAMSNAMLVRWPKAVPLAGPTLRGMNT